MSQLDRRELIAGVALASSVVAASSTASAQSRAIDVKAIKKDAEIAVLYHCDFGDPARIGQMITNIDNHLSVYDYDPFKIKIVIVAHSAGIKPFLDNLEGTPWAKDTLDPALFERINGLAKHGVEVLLCRITLKRNKIEETRVRADKFIQLVPSGVATVGELQAKGFGYLKVG